MEDVKCSHAAYAQQADYSNSQHAQEIVELMQAYALDKMGGGEPLSQYAVKHLIAGLKAQKNAFTVVGYVNNLPAGLINCIEGFSTFNAKQLVNIHDVIILENYRGQGLLEKMFTEVECIANNRGYCKLTLEVLEGNLIAKKAYERIGFSGYELDPELGKAMFWQKKLS